MRTYTGSTNCDDRCKSGNNKGKIMVNLLENIRDPAEIARLNQQYVQNGKPPKYDITKAHLNIYYEGCRTEKEAFEQVFGESMERYNNSQKRADRKTSMEKELAKLSKGKVQQELIHCMIAQVGNHDDHPPIEECIDILQEYRARFMERFPNMRIISCSIHLDELGDGTPHLQMYFIPVKTKEQHEAMQTGKKWKGMDIQPSLTGALEQMGYTNDAKVLVPQKNENGEPILGEDGEPVMAEVHDYKNGAMAQWQRDFNGLLDEICMEHDIAIDHYMRGKKVSHQDTRDYYDGKIDRETARAVRNRNNAEADLSNALLEVENAQGDAKKLQERNDTLTKQNEALEHKNEALERKNEVLEKEVEDLEKTIEASAQAIEQSHLRKADEYIAYYKRSRMQFEKDPHVYEAFTHARKMSRRVQNAWSKYRSSYTSFGRRRWAKKAIQLQEHANEAWSYAKYAAERSKFEREMKYKKFEIKKEVNEILTPHIDDFKNFCRIFDALSAEKQAKYRQQFEQTKKQNKKDIKDMSKHLNRLFGSKSMLEREEINQYQADRRSMNKLANKMLKDVDAKTEVAGDDIDITDMMAQYDRDYNARNKEQNSGDALESLLSQPQEAKDDLDDDMEL